jgi:hypothetical protein
MLRGIDDQDVSRGAGRVLIQDSRRQADAEDARMQQPIIESMEGRTLFSAAPGIPKATLAKAAAFAADPAVQADLALAQTDAATAAAAADKIKSDSADTRAALRRVTHTGNDLLKADRTAVLVALSGTDAKVLSDAQAKLATDRTQFATDTAAAKTAVRVSTADGRAALKAAITSLKTHLKQLKTDLRTATLAAKAANTASV